MDFAWFFRGWRDRDRPCHSCLPFFPYSLGAMALYYCIPICTCWCCLKHLEAFPWVFLVAFHWSIGVIGVIVGWKPQQIRWARCMCWAPGLATPLEKTCAWTWRISSELWQAMHRSASRCPLPTWASQAQMAVETVARATRTPDISRNFWSLVATDGLMKVLKRCVVCWLKRPQKKCMPQTLAWQSYSRNSRSHMVHCFHQQLSTNFRFFSFKVPHPWHWKAFYIFQSVDSESSSRPPCQLPAMAFPLLMSPAEQHKAWREPCGSVRPAHLMDLQVLALPKLKYGTSCSNACAMAAWMQQRFSIQLFFSCCSVFFPLSLVFFLFCFSSRII